MQIKLLKNAIGKFGALYAGDSTVVDDEVARIWIRDGVAKSLEPDAQDDEADPAVATVVETAEATDAPEDATEPVDAPPKKARRPVGRPRESKTSTK